MYVTQWIWFYLVLFACNVNNIACQQLLSNPGFEQALDGSDWFTSGGADLTRSTDAHTGLYSGRITARSEDWQVISQYHALEKGSTYYFEAWVKVLNLTAGYMYHETHLKVAIDYVDTGTTEHKIFSIQPYMRPGLGWKKLAGDYYLDDREFTAARLYIQVKDTYVEYLVDTTSLTKLTTNVNWKEEANARIESIRKNDVTINLKLSGDVDLELMKMQVQQRRHKFAFGSAVREEHMTGTDDDSLKYRDCFFSNFQWSVFHNAMKWRQMEWVQGELEYPDEALQVLRNRGYPVRGHCLFWGKAANNPPWVLELEGSDLTDAMRFRANDTMSRYKGNIVHWDVNNEQLSGDLWENKTGNVNFMTDLFKEIQAFDEEALLFLNEFNVLKTGTSNQAMVNLAEHMRSLGAPLGGIGIQSHLIGSVTPDEITALQKRLENVGKIGLPIFITELDISQVADAAELADAYDDVITLYFSNPAVEGVILWGFHDDNHWRPDAALFEGPDYTPNESGLRWQEMMTERWHTSVTFFPTEMEQTFGFRGFHGFYTLQLVYEDAVLYQMDLVLEDEDLDIDVEFTIPS